MSASSQSPSSSSSRRPYKRCPACGTRIALREVVCPICGHEFHTGVEADPNAPPATEKRPAIADTTRQRAYKPTTQVQEPEKSAAARVPWGIVGVVVVALAIVFGAAYLLRDTLFASRTPSLQPTIAVELNNNEAANLPTLPPPPEASPTTGSSPTPAGTPTPVPTDTPTPPKEYVVQPGDVCGTIADSNGIGLSVLAEANNLDATNCLIRAGQKLIIPVPTSTPGPAPTQGPDLVASESYEVQSGDACSTIADKFNISVDELIRLNNLGSRCLIQVGQKLAIRMGSATTLPTAQAQVATTPTPRTSYNAPVLISPRESQAITETTEKLTLEWLSVGLLRDNEYYVVQIQPSGAITVPVFETKATSLKITRAILGDQAERSFAWWVQVKQRLADDPTTNQPIYNPISQPSQVRRFTWRRPVTTVTPTP